MQFPSSLIKATIFTTMLVFGLAACRSEKPGNPVTYTPDQTYKLTILYTSDYPNTNSKQQRDNSIAAKTSLIKTIRSEVESQGSHMLLVSGGSTTPSPQEGIPEYFNNLDYDALVVSSYMFNQPMADIKDQQGKSSVPFISANIFESETGKPAFDAYTLVDAEDLTIAIVGITSRETERKQRINLSGLDVTYPEGRDGSRLIQQLEQQADIIILATHTGHIQQSASHISLDNLPGIDLVIGEHHRDMPLNPTIDAPVSCNEYVTRVDFEFLNGEVTVINREQLFIHDRDDPLMSI